MFNAFPLNYLVSCFNVLILYKKQHFFQNPNIFIKYLTLNAHKMSCVSGLVLLKAQRPELQPSTPTQAKLPTWLSLPMQNRSNSFYFQSRKYYVSYNQQTTKEHGNRRAISNKSFSLSLELHAASPFSSANETVPVSQDVPPHPSQPAFQMIQGFICSH